MQKLSALLRGAPLSNRAAPDAAFEGQNAALRLALATLESELGHLDATAGAALAQTKIEWQALIAMPCDFAGVSCKRAALLFSLHHEPLLRAPFAALEPELVNDLTARVLPLVIPPFVAGMAQNPHSLVIATLTLLDSWSNEEIVRGEEDDDGNAAYVEVAVGGLGDGGH